MLRSTDLEKHIKLKGNLQGQKTKTLSSPFQDTVTGYVSMPDLQRILA